MARIHVIGAGLAGLSAALASAQRRSPTVLYEAAPQAGGRCRSFYDQRLDSTIDNGAHVMLSGNRAALDFLRMTGGLGEMIEIAPAALPFLDLTNGTSWVIRPNAGPVPWWIFARSRRAAGVGALEHLRLRRLLAPPTDASIGALVDPKSSVFQRFLEPLAIAIMNGAPSESAAAPFARVVRRTFARGEAACRVLLPRRGLSAAFIEPALTRLASLGGEFSPGRRLTKIEIDDGRATALVFDDERIVLPPQDGVILSVPAHVAADLVPGLTVPSGANAIVNAHFRLDAPARLPGGHRLLGLVGGVAQWLVVRDHIVSVTVSGADAIVDRPAETLAREFWTDVARALALPASPPPPVRLVKERRATFAQTPANEALRPGPATHLRNLFLAGDWTATGLPATIEGAIQSGSAAAARAHAP